MRAVGVVEALEFGQLVVEGADAQLAGVELVELVAAGRVGALDAAVIFGASGRQHEQFDAAPLAGGLELGHEFAAAVDLHRLDIERRLADQMVEECRGAGGGGARAGAHAAKLRDRAYGLGLLDREAGVDGDAQVVDPDHLAGLSPAVAAAQAPLPAAGRRPGAAGRLQGGRFGRALKAQPVEQRETVEALGGLRRKLVAGRVETAEFAVRTFGLHGALSRLSAAG